MQQNVQEFLHLSRYFSLLLCSGRLQEQGSTILATYADKPDTVRLCGHSHFTSSGSNRSIHYLLSLLAPVFAWIWVKLGKRQPSIPQKFSLGLLFAGISFVVILIPGYLGGEHSLVSPLWLVFSIFIAVLGELCLSPVGLSAATKLAPAAFSAQTMSLWFLSNAAAQALNAQIVKFYTPETETLYFGVIGGLAIVLSILLFALAPRIQGFMKGVR